MTLLIQHCPCRQMCRPCVSELPFIPCASQFCWEMVSTNTRELVLVWKDLVQPGTVFLGQRITQVVYLRATNWYGEGSTELHIIYPLGLLFSFLELPMSISENLSHGLRVIKCTSAHMVDNFLKIKSFPAYKNVLWSSIFAWIIH